MTSNWPIGGWLASMIGECVCVGFEFGFQTWSPCKQLITPARLMSTISGHEKCRHFCCLDALTQICANMDVKNRGTSRGLYGYLCKSRILQILKKCQNPELAGFWCFFQNYKIPLVSRFIDHEMCGTFCPLDPLTQVLTAMDGQSRGTLHAH